MNLSCLAGFIGDLIDLPSDLCRMTLMFVQEERYMLDLWRSFNDKYRGYFRWQDQEMEEAWVFPDPWEPERWWENLPDDPWRRENSNLYELDTDAFRYQKLFRNSHFTLIYCYLSAKWVFKRCFEGGTSDCEMAFSL
jgi:hypothetical protein